MASLSSPKRNFGPRLITPSAKRGPVDLWAISGKLRAMSWPRPFLSVLAALEGLLDRGLCLLGAILFSQIPEFIQQYVQRLGGHLDEARRQLAQLRDIASQTGLTLDQLAARTAADPDLAVAQLGTHLHRVGARVHDLGAAEAAIRGASIWTRPFVFARYADPAIARSTWAVFKPAVPTTIEGLVYALAGVLFMLGLYYGGVKYPCRRILRARRRRQAPVNPSTGRPWKPKVGACLKVSRSTWANAPIPSASISI